MTITETLPTRPVRTFDPALDALAVQFADAAAAVTAVATDDLSDGAQRRARKLATQLRAASRLIARGAHLDAPTSMAYLERLGACTNWVSAGESAESIDGSIRSMRSVIVGLHTWRGHTGCLPAED